MMMTRLTLLGELPTLRVLALVRQAVPPVPLVVRGLRLRLIEVHNYCLARSLVLEREVVHQHEASEHRLTLHQCHLTHELEADFTVCVAARPEVGCDGRRRQRFGPRPRRELSLARCFSVETLPSASLARI
jgi:hypothetical protein